MRLQTVAVLLITSFILLHLTPYAASPYRFADADYLLVEKTVDSITTSKQNRYSPDHKRRYQVMRLATPLYAALLFVPAYTGLPLPLFLAILCIGLNITLFLTILHYHYYKWYGMLAGYIAIITLLHLPEFGTIFIKNRNVAIPIIVSYMLMIHLPSFTSGQKYLLGCFLAALLVGLYPPAGLILLIVALGYESNNSDARTKWKGLFLVLSGTAPLSPYLFYTIKQNMLSGFTPILRQTTPPLHYNFDSFQAILSTFLYSSNGQYIGAFVNNYNVLFTVSVLTAFILIGYYTHSNRFQWHRTDGVLLFAGIFLWGSAHIFFPLLGKPNRFSTITILAFLIVQTIKNTQHIIIGAQNLFIKNKKFVLTNPFLQNKTRGVFGIAGIVFLLFFVFCYHVPGINQYKLYDKSPMNYSAFIKKINKTVSADDTIIGPPKLLELISTKTGAGAAFSPYRARNKKNCRDFNAFVSAYFADINDTTQVRQYLVQNKFDYIIIDRTLFVPGQVNRFYTASPVYQNYTHPRSNCRSKPVLLSTISFALNKEYTNYTVGTDKIFYMLTRQEALDAL